MKAAATEDPRTVRLYAAAWRVVAAPKAAFVHGSFPSGPCMQVDYGIHGSLSAVRRARRSTWP